jgi:hypothetical protein
MLLKSKINFISDPTSAWLTTYPTVSNISMAKLKCNFIWFILIVWFFLMIWFMKVGSMGLYSIVHFDPNEPNQCYLLKLMFFSLNQSIN